MIQTLFSGTFLVIALSFSTYLSAQFPGAGKLRVETPSNVSNSQNETEENDTIMYSYSHIGDLLKEFPKTDTTLNESIFPIFTEINIHKTGANLGNLGSAVQNLIFSQDVNTGFNVGLNQYKAYNFTPENFKVFNQNKPIADLVFSQIGNQQNLFAGANFSRNFKDGISFSLNFKRIVQEGFYTGQNTKSTNFGACFRYEHPSRKYQSALLYLQNANEESNNGGIQPDSNYTVETIRSIIPTILNQAETRHQQKYYVLSQYYFLAGDTKSNWNLFLQNQTEYNPSYFKYSDVDLKRKQDTAHYGALLKDTRGIRKLITVNQFRNSFFINSSNRSGITLKTGLIYDFFSINNFPENKSRHDVTLAFKGTLPFYRNLYLNTNAYLGIGQNAGNFDLEGNLQFNSGKKLILTTSLKLFQSEQSYSSQVLILNNNVIRNINNDKSFGSILRGSLEIPFLKFKASISQQLWNKPVFWNKEVQPEQLDGLLSVTQLEVIQNFKLWGFHLDNHLYLQAFSNNVYNLPTLLTYHRFYWGGMLFKKVMEVNIGVNARIIPAYEGNGYSPVWGQFYASDYNLPFFPAGEIFLMAKVSKFKAMFKYENAGNLIDKNVNFDVYQYPQLDPMLRFVFSWFLAD
ncbi:MAG: hypothetical protein IPM42_19110 [Saprospiraceae bacterium]|nr:hypothetical protein [Saprospiraceae bacterium]